MSSNAISSLVQCNADGTSFTQTNTGFKLCSGTTGNGLGKTPSKLVPNNSGVDGDTYLKIYNYQQDNACISGGVPGQEGEEPWNTVPYQTAFGCCVAEKDWEAVTGKQVFKSNSSYATRLEDFSTASSRNGGQNSDNLDDGLPDELIALEKVWGMNKNWVHGGTKAGNIGVWNNRPDGFLIKYTSKASDDLPTQTWTQNSVLWSRMTGDNYVPKYDLQGETNPAPLGIYQSRPPGTLPKTCDACIVSNGGDSNTIFGKTSACENPYFQACAVVNDIPSSEFLQTTSSFSNATNPNTGASDTYTDPRGRCGGVFATRSMYGPGTFSVLANLPPAPLMYDTGTESYKQDKLYNSDFKWIDTATGKYVDANTEGALPGGRGYVFAIWTYGYTEVYQTSSATNTARNTAVIQNPGKVSYAIKQTNVTAEGYDATGKYTDVPATLQQNDGVAQDDGSEVFVAHNHEIDIELPSNSAQSQGENMMDVLTWSTANLNTWLTDTGNYDADSPSLYQQVQATLTPTNYFFAVNDGDDENTYHKYSFTWYVDPAYDPVTNPSAVDGSYVAFYLDDKLIYKSQRFVPRRSGRLLVGLWPAWWGSNYNPMTFSCVYAKIARIDILPQKDVNGNSLTARVTNAAQVYDQNFPMPGGRAQPPMETNISCGLQTQVQRTPTTPGGTPVQPPPAAPPARPPASVLPKKHLGHGAIIGIIIACIVAVLAIVLGIYYGLRKNRKR